VPIGKIDMILKMKDPETQVPDRPRRGEAGFSLIEVAIAMVIVLVSLLAVFYSFTYAIIYNAGNDSRAKALAVLQQEVEFLRSKKFTPTVCDTELQGGTSSHTATDAASGYRFTVTRNVDNDPVMTGLQDEATVPSATTGVKEIEIIVTLEAPSPGWQTAVPATVVMRRVRGN
jgi:prepilin-type N-terminal cleavage/methylation domain-containing protein